MTALPTLPTSLGHLPRESANGKMRAMSDAAALLRAETR